LSCRTPKYGTALSLSRFNLQELQKKSLERRFTMSMPGSTTITTTETSSGLFAEAVGGVASIVLAILGLSGVSPEYLLGIATIVFGAALVIEGTSIVADYAHILSLAPGTLPVGSGGISAVFLAGVSGIVLGVLALLGVHAGVLASAAVIVFGSALLLSSGVTVNLHMLKSRVGGAAQTVETSSESAGVKVLTGIAAVVLGILAAAGAATMTLNLVALLVLGGGILATGNGLNNAMTSIISSASQGARAH
jgi:hypothetical protein